MKKSELKKLIQQTYQEVIKQTNNLYDHQNYIPQLGITMKALLKLIKDIDYINNSYTSDFEQLRTTILQDKDLQKNGILDAQTALDHIEDIRDKLKIMITLMKRPK